jgi:hypothetical protein
MLVDADMASATAAFDVALELARVNGFAYLEMQCLALLACVAGIGGDYPVMVSAATGAEDVATARGWELSPLATAARWMLAYGALLQSEPVEAYRPARLRCGPADPRFNLATSPRCGPCGVPPCSTAASGIVACRRCSGPELISERSA